MKRKIFLADDSITIQKVVELTFPDTEYEVTCATRGQQAFESIKALQPDIALLDVVMPDRSGYEICAQIKKDPALRWMPVLLISGAFESFDEKRATDAGANGRLTKPFESRALVAKVEELMTAHPNPARPAEPAVHTALRTAPAPQPASPPQPAAAPTARIAARDLPPRGVSATPAAPAGGAPGGLTAPPQGGPKPAARPAPPTPAPPPRNAPAPAAAPPVPAASSGAPTPIPREVLDHAVREAVAAISEKVVREIAWEVIPDLAESIIQRRIRELEEEAASAR